MFGFYNRVLEINVTEKIFSIEVIYDHILEKTLGGKGLASYFLMKLAPRGGDPLSPDNPIIFTTGSATASSVWGSSRYGVFTKSPQTGLYAESYSGGKVPEAIDSTGFDAVIIVGKSPGPVVLSISPDSVEFHEADDLRGMDTYTTQKSIMKKFSGKKGYKKKGAVTIGPAAENGVSFSVIKNDYFRSAGRTGVGTVLGSKNVKGILFQGDLRRELYDKSALNDFSKKMMKENKDNPTAIAYKSLGTPMMVKIMNNAGAFPAKYWTQGTCDHWEDIGADALLKNCNVRPTACSRCFLACGKMSTIKEGRHKGLTIEGPEYETIFAFGGLCMVKNIQEVIYLNDVCDRLGIDTITAGNLCAFTMEAFKRNKVDYKIEYGDVNAISELLHNIAYRKDVGDILAGGIKKAAKEWGMEDIAVHVKGLEPAGYDPRVLKGMGLGYATSARGACHLRATFYKPELSGIIEPDTIDGKAALFVDYENRMTLFDTFVFCRFFRDFYLWESIGKILYYTTGLKMDKDALNQRANDITTLIRVYNLNEGLTPEDDHLPKTFHKAIKSTGQVIKEEELLAMLETYYALHGWGSDGRPHKSSFWWERL